MMHNGKKVQLGLETQAKEWAAPQARDHFPAHTPERIAKMKAEGHGMRNLNDEASHWTGPSATDSQRGGKITEAMTGTSLAQQVGGMQWSSPKTSDPEKAGPNMRGSKGDIPLPGQAANWPGPAARDHKGTNSAEHLEVSSGSLHLDQLPNFVEHCFRLPSSPARPIAGGSMFSTDSPNSNQPLAKRKLNPIFVEALMRWPTGLSGFERQETAWTRWWQLMPSFLSALCSDHQPPRQGSLF